MNLVLFEPHEIDAPLPRADRRARHVLEVLRRQVGDGFDAAIVNGARGKAVLTAIDAAALSFAFSPTHAARRAEPISLIVGLPRPQTARDILRDATTLGVGELHFVRTEKSDPSYAQSTLWQGEWRRHVLAGAEQAFDPRVPHVSHGQALAEALASPPRDATRLALDNYEAARGLSDQPIAAGAHVVLAVGAERGWSAAERMLLRERNFAFVHLGTRVLRTETAVVAALTLVRAQRGLLRSVAPEAG